MNPPLLPNSVNSISRKAFLLVTTLCASSSAHGQGLGDLVVTPTRLSLTDQQRSGSITVVNRGRKAIRYRLNLVDMEMGTDGILRRLASPSANSAASFLRMSPREVVLEPGGFQRIRVVVNLPENLTQGEYRSHLSFEPLVRRTEPTSTPSTGEGSFQFKLETIAIVSIPITFTHGRATASATLDRLELSANREAPVAKVRIRRNGSRTVRGNLSVAWVPANGGQRVELGHLDSLPVYFPNAERLVNVPLKVDPAQLGPGTIEATYVDFDLPRGNRAPATSVEWKGR